jgi:hypothetical protein
VPFDDSGVTMVAGYVPIMVCVLIANRIARVDFPDKMVGSSSALDALPTSRDSAIVELLRSCSITRLELTADLGSDFNRTADRARRRAE